MINTVLFVFQNGEEKVKIERPGANTSPIWSLQWNPSRLVIYIVKNCCKEFNPYPAVQGNPYFANSVDPDQTASSEAV